MVDPTTIFGVPPFVVAYVMAKCAYEVEEADGVPEERKNELYFQCLLENLIPTGLPNSGRYDNNDDS